MVPERTQARANPARGVALIATAVVVGFFLLRNGWNQNAPDAAAEAVADAAAAEGAPAPEGGAQAPPTTQPARTPDQITVQVLNASGVTGAAQTQSDEIGTQGYVMGQPANYEGETRDATAVVFVEGFDREAATLATQVGAPADQLLPVAEVTGVDPAQAQLFVLLGTDLAEGG